jgi:hypothetical protein
VEGGSKGRETFCPRAKSNRGQPRRPARQKQDTTKKFSFPFRRKNWSRANQKCRENFFAGWRASASGGGAASIVRVGFLLKKGSRKVYNYSTKTDHLQMVCFDFHSTIFPASISIFSARLNF